MVLYPTVDDIIKANKRAVRKDKHSHKLLRSVAAIQSLIDSIKNSASMGLTYQAARFMKEIVTPLHAFDGGNHRTAYSIANLFLIENGMSVRFVPETVSYAFAKAIGSKDVREVQEWIEQYMV
jgi:prophage maintenance system killer protein